MKDTKQPLFLLGGYDLEMCTIKTLLETHGIPYADHRLQWHTAYLSSYAPQLAEYGRPASPWRIYGLELQEDIPLPANYTRIDHHNRHAGLPSALEQVASLLQLPLDRRLRLIAANDRAYIPGMQALGATADEIAAIRLADRRAQGVTEEDEKLAEKAIAQQQERGGLVVVQALSPRFSPICDRLYPYRRLLIYTGGEWMYYGEGAARIKTLFEEEFQAGRLFCGGGVQGFVGAKQGVYSPLEIQAMVGHIQKEIAYGA